MNIIIFIIFIFRYLQASQISLDNDNKLNDMLVFINDNIPGDQGLLARIQDHISRSSMSLLKATGNMSPTKAGVQFGTVHIRVPTTWSVQANPVTWQQCNKADFYIKTTKDNDNSEEPFTKQLKKCGQPGDYTSFSDKFFKSKTENEMISAGRKIMNEFVKLRYGVYSEKPYNNMLVMFNGKTFINSTCGKQIQWEINKNPITCNETNNKCTYKILPNQQHTYSVMFDTDSTRSAYFCNNKDRPHNKLAKSLHNKKCDSRSVSTIILQHSDFRFDKSSIPFQNIRFEIVKGQTRKIALVLDTSGSMAGIIKNMKLSAIHFVTKIVEQSAYVGLADFNSFAKIKSVLLPMNNINNRNLLKSLINQLYSDGWTNIPDGLAKGVEILGSNIANDEKVFGTIILLTDGGNNRNLPYRYDYAITQVVKKGILVNTIAYGTAADSQLNKITKGTGGIYLYADTSSSYIEFANKFAIKQNCESSVGKEIKILESSVRIDRKAKINEKKLTFLDEYVGVNVRLSVTVLLNTNLYIMTLIGPSKQIYTVYEKVDQTSGTTLTFFIPGKPEKGMYMLRMEKRYARFKRQADEIEVKFTVSATQEIIAPRTIVPTGELSKSQIDLLTDSTTVHATVDLTSCGILPNEIVTVVLIIETPSLTRKELPMQDDGMGGDAIARDHIYGLELFPRDIESVGFYNFLALVSIVNNDTKEMIQRTAGLNSLRVLSKQSEPLKDKIPPEKVEIIDLVVINAEKKILKIRIYATGNDGITGQISKYDIMINSSSTDIINKEVRATPMEKIDFELDLSTIIMTDRFEASVRGVDDSGNIGEWSIPQPFNWDYNKIAKVFSDNIPPDRVQIIGFTVIDLSKHKIDVRINATGNNGMEGNISRYEIMINGSTTYIFNKTAHAQGGDIVDFQLDLANLNITDQFETSVRGIDDNGNIGDWSVPKFMNFKSLFKGGNGSLEKLSLLLILILLSFVVIYR